MVPNLIRGREVHTAGDGFLATFDGPARAVMAARGIREAVGQLGLQIKVGLHTGECELVPGGVRGIAVHTGCEWPLLPSQAKCSSPAR